MHNRSMSRQATIYAVVFFCLSLTAAALVLLAFLFLF
jgi:hypothetical protein